MSEGAAEADAIEAQLLWGTGSGWGGSWGCSSLLESGAECERIDGHAQADQLARK